MDRRSFCRLTGTGATTEFIRCPDPTSGLVAKITRTRIA